MHIRQSGAQSRVSEPSPPADRTGGEPMEVQTVDKPHSLRPRSSPPLKSTGPDTRTITDRQTVTITVDQQAGIYRADSTIFAKEITPLPYNQLADIAGFLQQTDPDNPNTQSNRVTGGPSPIAGSGAFAKRPYQKGEIIGFYTGNLVLRKPMPERLLTRYQRLTKKKWQDMLLPLYSIWQHNPTGSVQYQTGADTYIAWSQVKIYNKGIELGIDGQYSNNPLRLLNHSREPNTALFPTVSPDRLQHIRADGQTYVKADVDLTQCLLIPVLALEAIDRDRELTFHYGGYGYYPGCPYNFADTGKDIVSNPEEMMTQKPGEFPEYIRATGGGSSDSPGTGPRMGKDKQIAQHGLPQPPQEDHPSPTDSTSRPASEPLLSGRLPNPGIVIHDLCIPLSPIRLDQESDQDFTARIDRLINQPRYPTPRESACPGQPGVRPICEQEQQDDWDEDDQLEPIDWESDGESVTSEEESITDSEDEFSPNKHWDSRANSLSDLDDSSEDEPGHIPSKASQMTRLLSRKRGPLACDKPGNQIQTNTRHRNALLGRIRTAPPGEYPGIIWDLFSLYCRIDHQLLGSYQRLCKVLNVLAIPHNIDGEEPEWTPALAYHYFVVHRYIDAHSDTNTYQLMPVSILKERVAREQDGRAFNEVERFCLEWLRHHHFRCHTLAFWLNRYGLYQRNGSQWDVPDLHRLIGAYPLSDQELTAWQETVNDPLTLVTSLWCLIRSGHEKALHAFIRHYVLTKKANIRSLVIKLNTKLCDTKSICDIACPWSQSTLFKYIIRNDLLDFNDAKKVRRLIPYQTGDLIKILTATEKQKLASKTSGYSESEITTHRLEVKLLGDYIANSPEQREQNLAQNLFHLFLDKANGYRHYIDVYNSLASLLTRYQIHTDCCSRWSVTAIYEFWLSQNILDETTQYSVMNFTIFKHRMDKSEDSKKEIAHYFQHWIKTKTPTSFVIKLGRFGIMNQEKIYTIDDLFALLSEYDLSHCEKDITECTLNSGVKNDLLLSDLPRRIRQYKDKAVLKKYVENWLIRVRDKKTEGLCYIARHIKQTLIKKDSDEETLQQFRDAFQHEVWTTQGLFNFIVDEHLLDFTNPQSLSHLSPTEAARFLPNAHCLDYACYAISEKIPARFISLWEERCRLTPSEFSPRAFYGALARHLAEKKISWPYTPQEIRSKYNKAKPDEMRQLQALLKLETLQFQETYGYQRAPDSLLVLLHLLRKYVAKGDSRHVEHILNRFQIKIPRDGECVVSCHASLNSRATGRVLDQTSVYHLGQAGTIYWFQGNIKKLLALHDQKFYGIQGAA